MSELVLVFNEFNLEMEDLKDGTLKVMICDGEIWPSVNINKKEAIQIIEHLQKQFKI